MRRVIRYSLRPATTAAIVLATIAFSAVSAGAASSPERAEAMAKFARLSGVWRGPASGVGRDGTTYELTQTERVGPMLDGDVVVIEGRGYKADGSVSFNALAIISWVAQTNTYEFRSYAQGHGGTFVIKPTEDGFVWEVPAGPGAVMRYTAEIGDRTWHEVGEYVAGESEPRPMFEMSLVRVGDTAWPAEGAVPMK